MEFGHLLMYLQSQTIGDHHELIEKINKDWAKDIGFQVKIRRSPKHNKDGSSTLRLYCIKFLSNANLEQKKHGKFFKETNATECCPFGITFRFDPSRKTWLVYEDYDPLKMKHNHVLDKFADSSLAVSVDKYRDKISEISKFGKMADSLVPSEIPTPIKEE